MNGERKYSKHYTSDEDSLRIFRAIRPFLSDENTVVCDPCAGAMNLLKPFLSCPNVRKIIAADIYPDNQIKGVQSLQTNSLTGLTHLFGKISAIVTNPPFGRRGHPRLEDETQENIDEHLENLEQTIGLALPRRVHNLELAFLSLCLSLLKPNGVCAIVLPESVFSCASYESFRQHFQKHFEIVRIEQLSANAFSDSNANVNTGVLYFRKKCPSGTYQYRVYNNSGTTHLSNSSHSNWYPWKNTTIISPPKAISTFKWGQLGEVLPDLQVKSGYKGPQPKVFSKATSDDCGYYITSRHINQGVITLKSEFVLLVDHLQRTIANPGDVMLVRSGSGCVGRAAEVPKGLSLPLVPRSEIYVITNFKSDFERRQFLLSISIASLTTGRPWWISQLASGVGTPNLNKREIARIPIIKVDTENELRRLESFAANYQPASMEGIELPNDSS